MKLAVICFVLVGSALAFPPGPGPFDNAEIATCLKNRSITFDQLRGNMFPPTTDSAKCAWFCIYSAEKIMNADKTLNTQKAIDKLSSMGPPNNPMKDKIQPIVEGCKNSATSSMSDCDAAGAIATCIVKGMEEAGFKPPQGPPGPQPTN